MDTKVKKKKKKKKPFYLRVYTGNYVGVSNRHSYKMACAYFIKLLNHKLRKNNYQSKLIMF